MSLACAALHDRSAFEIICYRDSGQHVADKLCKACIARGRGSRAFFTENDIAENMGVQTTQTQNTFSRDRGEGGVGSDEEQGVASRQQRA